MFYFVLGLLIIFMDNFPLDMAVEYRWAFGLLHGVFCPSWGGLLMIIETKMKKKVLRIRYLTVFVSVLALAYACKQSGKDDGKETILRAKQLFWLMIPFSL
jgi:hypothetical protein